MAWLQSLSKPHDAAIKIYAVLNKRKILKSLFRLRSNFKSGCYGALTLEIVLERVWSRLRRTRSGCANAFVPQTAYAEEPASPIGPV
jgi:hypothetical protein